MAFSEVPVARTHEKLERLELEAAIRQGAGMLKDKDKDYPHWRDTESIRNWVRKREPMALCWSRTTPMTFPCATCALSIRITSKRDPGRFPASPIQPSSQRLTCERRPRGFMRR